MSIKKDKFDYKATLLTNSFFEIEGSEIMFLNSKLSFIKGKGSDVIEKVEIYVHSKDMDKAQKKIKKIAKKFNKIFLFQNEAFILNEPIDLKGIKDLETGKMTYILEAETGSYTLSFATNHKVSLSKLSEIISGFKANDKAKKALSYYSDAKRVKSKELKFLSFYKSLFRAVKENNGISNHKDLDNWLTNSSGLNEKYTKKKDRQDGHYNKTRLVHIRMQINYSEKLSEIHIEKEDIKAIKKIAKREIKKLL